MTRLNPPCALAGIMAAFISYAQAQTGSLDDRIISYPAHFSNADAENTRACLVEQTSQEFVDAFVRATSSSGTQVGRAYIRYPFSLTITYEHTENNTPLIAVVDLSAQTVTIFAPERRTDIFPLSPLQYQRYQIIHDCMGINLPLSPEPDGDAPPPPPATPPAQHPPAPHRPSRPSRSVDVARLAPHQATDSIAYDAYAVRATLG